MKPPSPDRPRADRPRHVPFAPAAIGLQILGLIAANALWTRLFAAETAVAPTTGDGAGFWTGPLPLLAAAPLEELLFRGLVFGLLQARGGPALAIGGSALLFGLAHGVGPAAWIAGLLGLQLGALRLRHGLGVAVLAHLGNNLAVLAVRSGPADRLEGAETIGWIFALALAGSALAALARPTGRPAFRRAGART